MTNFPSENRPVGPGRQREVDQKTGFRDPTVRDSQLHRVRRELADGLASVAGGGPHAASHQNAGADEINVAGLSGVLADPQTPAAHGPTTHQNGQADEFSVAGLSGVLADPQVADKVLTTSGPTTLTVGAIADGEFLKRDGATVVGAAGGGGGAPTTAEYLVGAADGGLSAERVVTDTATIEWDLGTAGQAKADVVSVPAHEHVAADVTDLGDLATIDVSGDATEFLRGDGVFAPVIGVPTTKRLNTQHDIASATGTEVTDLSVTLAAGTYVFTYYLITQASNTTVGLALGINYTGTVTRMAAHMRYADTGTTATTGVADSATAGVAEEMVGVFATITESTTACNLGPLTNHDAANTNTLIIVEGIMVVSDGGDIELWHNSDSANTTSIMVGSSLVLIKTA